MERKETISNHFLNFVNTIDNPSNRARALFSLLKYDRLTHQAKQFEQVIYHLPQAARAVDSINLSFSILLNTVKEHQKVGQISKAADLLVEALSLANRLQDVDLKNNALKDIARAYAKSFDPEQALKIAQSIHSHHFRYEALIWVIKSYAQNHNFDQATELAESIGVSRYQVEAFDSITLEYINAGRLEEALRFAGEKKISVEQNSVLLKKLAEGYSKQNNYDKAIQISKMTNNSSVESSILNVTTEECVASGELDKALEIAQSISRKDIKENAILSVVKGYSNSGHYTQALSIMQFLKQGDYKAIALEHIISSCITKELIESCSIVLSQSYLIAQKIRIQEIQFSVLIQIIDSYLRIGFIDEATKVLKTLHQKNKKLQVTSDVRDFMICQIGIRWARLREFDKSFEIANDLKACSKKSIILGAVSAQLLVMGQESKAEELFREAFLLLQQEDLNKIESTLQQIVDELVCTKSYSKAIKIVQLISSNFVTSNCDAGITSICWLASNLLRNIDHVDGIETSLNQILKDYETKPDEIKTKLVEGIFNFYERF